MILLMKHIGIGSISNTVIDMRILLTGKNGQVGFELQRSLAPLGQVIATDVNECDLTDLPKLRECILRIKPDIIVNPAAYTAVDKAEFDQEKAELINAKAPGVIAEEAEKINALVIHYSTDYVFNGEHKGGYSETDQPDPKSIYGKTKLAGEQLALNNCSKVLVLRTSWVFGSHGHNFIKTILRLATEKKELNIISDQCGAPTSASLIADITAQIIGQYSRQDKSIPYGLYHLTASGVTTWHEYASYVVQAALEAGCQLQLSPDDIRPITTADYPVPAARPLNSVLKTDKLRKAFGLTLPSWDSGLQHVLHQLLSKL